MDLTTIRLACSAFFDSIKDCLPVEIRDEIQKEINAVMECPESLPYNLTAMSKQLSSGMIGDEGDTQVKWEKHKKTRLVPLLGQLVKNEKNTSASSLSYAYPLKKISPENIFPKPQADIVPENGDEAEKQYRDLFDKFPEKLKKLQDRDNIELWFENFESLMMLHLSSVPAPGFQISDVSLYDYAKVTSALSVAAYLYHEKTREPVPEDIDYDTEKFLFISGGMTGTGMFAPYTMEGTWYHPETRLVIFVLLDERATDPGRLILALENIGKCGYGADASTGMGRFTPGKPVELPTPGIGTGKANALYSLAPSVPDVNAYEDMWYTPFIRFGKHGDRLASMHNPFKNPVIMADEGAVFKVKTGSSLNKPYIGRGITKNVSLALENTVVQGYAPYLPVELE